MQRYCLAAALLVASVSLGSRYPYESGFTVIALGTLAPTLLLGAGVLLCRNTRPKVLLGNALLAIASVGIGLLAMEGVLEWEAAAGPAHLSIPDEWKLRPTRVDGAAHAYYWHGHLNVYNKDSFRTVGNYVREDDKRRIILLGDSLTYGYGVAAADTYAEVLASLGRKTDPAVRIYNLGVNGYNSQDMLRVAAKWVPILAPEQVVYGICLNDFLPSGVGEYKNAMAWSIPVFEAVKTPFETRTRLGGMLTDLYNRALIRLKIRDDFVDDILKDFGNYQTRFRRDLVELNGLAVKATGKPVVALVFNQRPSEPRLRRLASIAEAAAAEAGMKVIPTTEYYQQLGDGNTQLHVSQWEGHPNELAHRLYAAMLAPALGLSDPLRLK